MVPFIVDVNVTVSVDPTIETDPDPGTLVYVKVPLASANRPVPPVTVSTRVDCIGGPKVPAPEMASNSWSPLAATTLPVPVQLNPFAPIRANCSLLLPVTAPRRES